MNEIFPYPLNTVWYVEADPGNGGPVQTGSAVAVELAILGSARKVYLLTCQHVVRENRTGPYCGTIRVWQPGKGYAGPTHGWLSQVASFNNLTANIEAQPYMDWLVLDVDTEEFQNVPRVTQWTDSSDDLTVIGYPAGAFDWKPTDIVEPTPLRQYSTKLSRSSGIIYLTGPAETHAGMSGGGVFDQSNRLVGLHRESFKDGAEYRSVSAMYIMRSLDQIVTAPLLVDGLVPEPGLPTLPPNILLCFIHGLYGDSTRSWRKLKDRLTSQLPASCHSESFPYPAGLFNRISVEQGESLLAAFLSDLHMPYNHIVFVCHSAGGIILKNYLAHGDSAPVLEKCRYIINIGVPHHGSSSALSRFFTTSYSVFWALFSPVARLLPSNYGFGRNDLIYQLRHGSPLLLQIDLQFQSTLLAAAKRSISIPQCREFVGLNDTVIHHVSDRKLSYVLDGHGGSKDAPNDTLSSLTVPTAIIRAVTQCNTISYRLAERLWKFSTTELSRDRVTRLFGSTTKDSSQEYVHESLLSLIWDCHSGPRSYVLTGPAGTGKSIVLQRLCQSLSARILSPSKDTSESPLLMFAPLRDITIDAANLLALCTSGNANQNVASVLISSILQWIHGLRTPDNAAPVVETQELISNRHCILILDGVDEFLLKHRMPFRDFVTIVRSLEDCLRKNRRLAIVFGVRDSIGDVHELASVPSSDCYRLGLLDDASVKSVCEEALRIFALIDDKQLIDILRTALFLMAVTPYIRTVLAPMTDAEIRSLLATEQNSRTQILDLAAETLLVARPDLGRWAEAGKNRLGVGDLKASISILARCLYEGSQSEELAELFPGLTPRDLSKWANANSELWQPLYTSANEDVATAFRYLASDENARNILQNSVFMIVREDSYRLRHALWDTYFVAYYYYLAFESAYVEAFDVLAIPPEIVYSVGNLLDMGNRRRGQGVDPTRALVDVIRQVLLKMRKDRNLFSAGNILAIICGNERDRLLPEIADVVMENLASIHPVAQCIAVAAMSHTLVEDPVDRFDESSTLERTKLRGDFAKRLTALIASDETHALLASLSQGFLHAYGAFNGKDVTSQLTKTPMVKNVAHLMCHHGVGESSPSLSESEARSFQRAILGLVKTIWRRDRYRARSIQSIHYLYMLTCLKLEDLLITEVKRELGSLFATQPDQGPSEYERAARAGVADNKVLLALFEWCKELIVNGVRT